MWGKQSEQIEKFPNEKVLASFYKHNFVMSGPSTVSQTTNLDVKKFKTCFHSDLLSLNLERLLHTMGYMAHAVGYI